MKWASPLSCCHKPKMMGRVWRSVLFLAPPCVAFAHFVLWRKHVDRLQRLQAAEQILLSAEETLNRKMEKVRRQLMSDE